MVGSCQLKVKNRRDKKNANVIMNYGYNLQILILYVVNVYNFGGVEHNYIEVRFIIILL